MHNGSPVHEWVALRFGELSIGNINTLFSLFHQEKKDINDAVQPWGIRNLTDFGRHTQYRSFQGINPATISRQACRLPAAALAN
jgi:hypothetical protein